MIYQVEKILQDVRVCLDRNKADNALLSDGDEETLLLDDIIRSKITEGVDAVHSTAPYWTLEQGHNFGDTEEVSIHWGDQESGWVLVPEDFLRLVVFEMSDWERPVYEVRPIDDPRYAQCHSRIKAIRGTAQRPMVFLAVKPFGRVLEFYSCKSEDAAVSRAVYIPKAEIDKRDRVDISERCYNAVVYTIAGLTLSTIGEAQQSEAMLSKATIN